jgi:integrase
VTPSQIAIYLTDADERGAGVSTLRRRLAAINFNLRQAQEAPISIRDEPLASVWQGIVRARRAPPKQARAIEVDELRFIVTAREQSLSGVRDRALLLLGFAGAFRRSELAGLDWSPGGEGSGYVEAVPEGLRVRLRRSKTNQMGDLEEVAICRGAYASTCPVAALEAWRAAVVGCEAAAGPVFVQIDRFDRSLGRRLSGAAISEVIRKAVVRHAAGEGATPAEALAAAEGVSGHSLRAGLVTTAFGAGISAEDIARQTRHRNTATLAAYRRHRTAFVSNVSGRIGL